MSSVDSLNELANALETFFKGLSECGLLTTYSVQLQLATVDFVVQIKFHCLIYQLIKALQTLLIKTSIPGHESCRDIAVQTPVDFGSVFAEIKQNETSPQVSSELRSLVGASVFSRADSDMTWDESETHEDLKDDQNATFVVRSNDNCTSTDIIVTCHPAALAAIAGHNIVASSESISEDSNSKKLDLSCESEDHFRDDSENKLQIISTGSSPENELCVSENSRKNMNAEKAHLIEVDCNEHLENDNEEMSHGEIKSLESAVGPLILKTYVEEQSVMNDNLSVMHIVVASDNAENKTIVHKAEKEKKKPFKCKDCDRSFTSTQSLDVHLSRKHAAKEQCDMCPRSFSSIQSLQEHCRIEHAGMGCFNCLLCSRRFMTKLSFKRHMDTHVGKKEAVCDMCGKTFSRADYLNKHYMTHSGARPLSCSQCPRKFISSSHLKNHEKTHTGEREHLCKLCPKSFSRADKLKEHTLRHLNIKRFQCTECKRTYAEKRDLTKHMRSHEKGQKFCKKKC